MSELRKNLKDAGFADAFSEMDENSFQRFVALGDSTCDVLAVYCADTMAGC